MSIKIPILSIFYALNYSVAISQKESADQDIIFNHAGIAAKVLLQIQHYFCIPLFSPTIYRVSIRSGHRLIGAELERIVIIENLFMEVVSIVIQHPLNPL
jgi:hypothetical protein